MQERRFDLVRKMGSFDVLQRTNDGMFNASALLKQWNAVDGNTEKKLVNFLNLKSTLEFAQAIIVEEFDKTFKLSSHSNDSYYGDSQLLTNCNQVLKLKKGRNTAQGRTPDEVWMHPLMFVDFAMWLNPKFKYHVLKFVQDKLIWERNRIADSHRKWTDMLQLLGCKDNQYAEVQKAMNFAVFGESYEGIRNFASEEQLLKMSALEQSIEQAVSFGLIKDLAGVGSYLNKVYEQDFPQDTITQ